MAELLPKTPQDYVRALLNLWWIPLLVAVERLADGHYYQCAALVGSGFLMAVLDYTVFVSAKKSLWPVLGMVSTAMAAAAGGAWWYLEIGRAETNVVMQPSSKELALQAENRDLKKKISDLSDQLSQERAKPPQVVVREKQVPIVIHDQVQPLTPEQAAKLKDLRNQLSAYLSTGNQLDALLSNPDKPAPTAEADAWAAEVENYLRANLEESYVVRFRDPNVPIHGQPVGIGNDRLGYWNGVYNRTIRLAEFIKEMSK